VAAVVAAKAGCVSMMAGAMEEAVAELAVVAAVEAWGRAQGARHLGSSSSIAPAFGSRLQNSSAAMEVLAVSAATGAAPAFPETPAWARRLVLMRWVLEGMAAAGGRGAAVGTAGAVPAESRTRCTRWGPR
jgi:hypothetical protein